MVGKQKRKETERNPYLYLPQWSFSTYKPMMFQYKGKPNNLLFLPKWAGFLVVGDGARELHNRMMRYLEPPKGKFMPKIPKATLLPNGIGFMVTGDGAKDMYQRMREYLKPPKGKFMPKIPKELVPTRTEKKSPKKKK